MSRVTHEPAVPDEHESPTTPSPTDTPSALVAVLAAGRGSRFAGPHHKLVARLPDGTTVAEHSIATALDSDVGPVVVIVGATPLEIPDGATAVVNPAWADGQATSLQCAVAEAQRRNAEVLVVGLADQPGVTPEAWRLVAASDSPIAVATYTDTGPEAARNPVRLHRDVWPLLAHEGDHGARDVIRVRPDLVERVPCPGTADDIDRPEDLTRLEQRWQNNSSTNSS